MTFITKSKKPIQTTEGHTFRTWSAAGHVVLFMEGKDGQATWLLTADSASRLAVELRLMAIEVEGRGKGK